MKYEVAVIKWESIAYHNNGLVVAEQIGTKEWLYKSEKLETIDVKDKVDNVLKTQFLDKGWSLVAIQPELTEMMYVDTEQYVKYYVQRGIPELDFT